MLAARPAGRLQNSIHRVRAIKVIGKMRNCGIQDTESKCGIEHRGNGCGIVGKLRKELRVNRVPFQIGTSTKGDCL